MKNKLQIIHTDDYVLAVSDGEIKKSDKVYWTDPEGLTSHLNTVISVSEEILFLSESNSSELECYVHECKKIIAYQPKGNAPELDLPLLPEIVVEDDVENLAYRIYPPINTMDENGNDLDLNYGYRRGFEEGLNYKAATKKYSEEDLKEAFLSGCHNMSDYIEGESESDDYDIYKEADNYIQSLKTHTPKWFVAETVCDQCLDDKTTDSCYCHFGNYKTVLKTTTIEGKVYLVGKFIYE